MTRRILYGNCRVEEQDDLEAIFNDDEVEIKDGPEMLSRRTNARMEAFLACCSVALREEDGGVEDAVKKVQGKVTNKEGALARVAPASLGKSPRVYRQIGHADLMHRLELHCRT